jgi:hypothetical protein
MCGVCGMKVYSVAVSCTLAALMPHLRSGVDVRRESRYRKNALHNEMNPRAL